jgi:hypothetical protein
VWSISPCLVDLGSMASSRGGGVEVRKESDVTSCLYIWPASPAESPDEADIFMIADPKCPKWLERMTDSSSGSKVQRKAERGLWKLFLNESTQTHNALCVVLFD